MHGRWSRLPAWLALSTALFLCATPAGQAEEKDLADLRARLDRLEQQNANLAQQNAELQELLQALRTRLDQGAPLAPPALPRDPTAGQQEVQRLVREYLKSQEEEKKAKESEDHIFHARWKDGLELETKDKDFKVRIGGRTQFDGAWMDADQNVMFGPHGTGPIEDAVNFRRARLDVEATMYHFIDFYCQFDFLNTFNAEGPHEDRIIANTPVPTDLWATFTHLPCIGNVRVGNMKPPLGFEHLTSSRYLNFMERSQPFDAFLEEFDNGFRPGVMLFNQEFDERMTWWLGFFKNVRKPFGWDVGDGQYDVTARVTALPIYLAEGRYLLHLGLGSTHRDPDADQYRSRARTDVRNGPAALHTLLLDARMFATGQSMVVPELAIVAGPFSLQAEYIANWVQDATTPFPAVPGVTPTNHGTVFFHGYYVEALWFLTGEHRPYNKKAGAFGRVIPLENFFLVACDGTPHFGKGAWQIGVRYSYLDLDNRGLEAGTLHDWTIGLNWFLNPNMKFQCNYARAYRDVAGADSDGIIDAFGMRLAWDY